MKQLTLDTIGTPVPRKNRALYAPGELLLTGSYDRYTDPLIRWKNHTLFVPEDREEVSAQDPIANILTWSFAFRAWAKYPKFYDSDQLDAVEIGLATRQLLQAIKFHQPASIAWALVEMHGWSVTIFNTDENGDLDYYIFSERECKPQNIIRDLATNRVIGWRVYEKPRLPMGRPVYTQYNAMRTVMRDDPGVIYLTRGDEIKSYGFGFSVLEPTWDAITKLREESHANAFRARVFPISVVPGNWQKPQIEGYLAEVAKMDMMNALVTKSGKNDSGELVPELPSFNWLTPASSASGKSSQGGGGVFSDLSSEWTRLCGITHRSIRYYTGNPGGALAAADVDQEQDSIADIEEFNLLREYVMSFIDWLLQEKMELDLPEGYTIKGHWEWERDELALQQQMMAERDMAIQDEELAQKKGGSPTQNTAFVEKIKESTEKHIDGIKEEESIAEIMRETGMEREDAMELHQQLTGDRVREKKTLTS